jgi:hypothetical protein
MPGTKVRRVRAALLQSKAITELLKLLNGLDTYADPAWDGFRLERLEDLAFMQRGDRAANPPADRMIRAHIMGVMVPQPRLVGGVVAVAHADFNGNERAMRLAFVCRCAISELADAWYSVPGDVAVNRCPACGTWLFGRRHCDESCEARARRRRRPTTTRSRRTPHK